MIVDERVLAKVAIVFKSVDDFLSGKETKEVVKSQLNSEMNMIRPMQFEAVKRELRNRIENSANPEQRSELVDLFSPYLSPPYERLETGHPIKQYVLENQIIREHLLHMDSCLGDAITIEAWQSIYRDLLIYKKHIKRQQSHFYKIIREHNMDVQIEKAIEMGVTIMQALEVNSKRLEAGAYFEFLLDQQAIVQMLMTYLNIEERILFVKALHVLDSEALINLRALDDQVGYTFENKPKDFRPKGIQIVSQAPQKSESLMAAYSGFEWILPFLINSKKMKLILFDTSGTLISKFGEYLEADDLKISKKTLDFINDKKSVCKKYREKRGDALLDVTYTLVTKEDSIEEAVIIKTIEPFYECEMIENELFDTISRGEVTLNRIEVDQTIQALFIQYPQFKNDFFNLDEELASLKTDPMSMQILSEATVEMVAKSLRIDLDEFLSRINEVIYRYEKPH